MSLQRNNGINVCKTQELVMGWPCRRLQKNSERTVIGNMEGERWDDAAAEDERC